MPGDNLWQRVFVARECPQPENNFLLGRSAEVTRYT